jgi:hypothetical protein
MLGDHDHCAARVEFGNDGVGIERLVGHETIEGEILDQWRDADDVATLVPCQNPLRRAFANTRPAPSSG